VAGHSLLQELSDTHSGILAELREIVPAVRAVISRGVYPIAETGRTQSVVTSLEVCPEGYVSEPTRGKLSGLIRELQDEGGALGAEVGRLALEKTRLLEHKRRFQSAAQVLRDEYQGRRATVPAPRADSYLPLIDEVDHELAEARTHLREAKFHLDIATSEYRAVMRCLPIGIRPEELEAHLNKRLQRRDDRARSARARQDAANVPFKLSAPDANEVLLVGSFNGWPENGGTTMTKGSDGIWRTMVYLKPGRYEYRFKVNGHWVDDPDNYNRTPNPHGSENCVINA
jgi:hypothetical protein